MDYYSAPLDRAWEATKGALRHLEPPRLLAITCAAVFSAATIARSVEFSDKDFWAAGEPATFILVGTGVVAGIGGVISAVKATRRTRSVTLSEACVQLAAYIDEEWPLLRRKRGIRPGR